MPTLQIKTNVKTSTEQQKQILKDCSGVFSRLMGKPEKMTMVLLDDSISMIFDGSFDPSAFCKVSYVDSIVNLGEFERKQLSNEICELMHTHFRIPSKRVFIIFDKKTSTEWGWNGTTVNTLVL